jgi:hypothetical protein
MSEWRNIETAPRDGTIIDVWVHHISRPVQDGFRVADVSWVTHLKARSHGWYQERPGGDGLHDPTMPGKKVTHWMPLPSAPA